MKKAKDIAYVLVVALGTIHDEMRSHANAAEYAPTEEEVGKLYAAASELYDILDGEEDYPGDYVPEKTPDELWLEAQSNEAETIYFNS